MTAMTTLHILSSRDLILLPYSPHPIPYTAHHLTAHFSLSPLEIAESPLLRGIADLELAAANGDVEWEQDVILSRPTDLTASSGLVVLDYPNRGTSLVGALNGAPHLAVPEISGYPAVGDALLQRHGHTTLSLGWQGDIQTDWDAPMLGARYPVLQGVTGWVEVVHVFDDLTTTTISLPYPLANPSPYPSEDIQIQILPYPHPITLTTPLNPYTILTPTTLHFPRPPGTDAGTRYSIRYLARDPIVQGLALVGTQMLAHSLRSGGYTLPHPSAIKQIPISHIITLGISQTGRLQRDLLSSGFAPTETFDGHFIFIPGSKTSFTNRRWAEPGRSGLMYEDGVVWGGVRTEGVGVGMGYEDLLALGRSVGGEEGEPKIFHTDTSAEFYQAGSSLLTTALSPTSHLPIDSPIPDNVRHYLISSSAHAPYPSTAPPPPGLLWQPNNLNWRPVLRGLFVKFVGWVREGREPGEGCWPRVDRGELVEPGRRDEERVGRGLGTLGKALGLRDDVGYLGNFNPLPAVSFTTGFAHPTSEQSLPILIPTTDADGHDLPGIRLPHIVVPDAHRMGWSLRPEGFDGGMAGKGGVTNRFMGSRIPFPRTRKDAKAQGKGGRSMEERYPGGEEEVWRRREEVVRGLVERGFVLEEDAGDLRAFAV